MRRPTATTNSATSSSSSTPKRPSKKTPPQRMPCAQQQQQPPQILAAIVRSPMPARFISDELPEPPMGALFERDDAKRENLFHMVLLRVASHFSKGNLSVEREDKQRWSIMSDLAQPVYIDFTLHHRRVHILTNGAMTLGTRSTYDIELLLPGPCVKVSDIALMDRNNTARVLEALRVLEPAIFH